MKYSLTSLAFGLGASAGLIRREQCCFELTASGPVSVNVGQLTNGHFRIGGDYAPAKFCLNRIGAVTDSNGSLCIPMPNYELGCIRTLGGRVFSLEDDGTLAYHGNNYQGETEFYACPMDDDEDGYSIHVQPVEGQSECVAITLSSNGQCATGSSDSEAPASKPSIQATASSAPRNGSVPAYHVRRALYRSPSAPWNSSVPAQWTARPSAPASNLTATYSVAPSISKPSTSAPTASHTSRPSEEEEEEEKEEDCFEEDCPADLKGEHQYPHLIIPVDSSAPHKAPGTSLNGLITSNVPSIFNFDIPASYEGKTCSLIFLFPHLWELETSSYSWSGSGSITFSELECPATLETSYSNAPAKAWELETIAVRPGNNYVVDTFPCDAGESVAYELSGDGISLDYFQDYNPEPLGLYIRAC